MRGRPCFQRGTAWAQARHEIQAAGLRPEGLWWIEWGQTGAGGQEQQDPPTASRWECRTPAPKRPRAFLQRKRPG